MIPDKIYIQPNAHDKWWDGNMPNDNFQEYIRKGALLEWINKARTIPHENAITRDLAFQEVVNKLNEM